MALARKLPLAGLLLALLWLTACRSTAGSEVRYEVRFRGNESVGAATLDDVIIDYLSDFERLGYRRSTIDDAAFAIEDHYRSRGWREAQVDFDVRGRDDDELLVVFEIVEGVRTELGRIEFTGNTALASPNLREVVSGPSRGLLDRRRWFVQGNVDGAVRGLVSRYLARGYLRVRVSSPFVTFRDSGRVADVVYEIDEGPRYEVSSIELGGELAVPKEDLVGALPVEVGAPFTPEALRSIRSSLLEHLGTAGYPDAEVEVERTVDDGAATVALAVTIRAGEHVVVDGIVVEGNERTRSSLVRSRVEATDGEPFTPEMRRTSFSQLFSTGLFSKIQLELEGSGGERPLRVRVEELPSREVFVEPGWGSYELLRLKTGYRNRNVFGTGRSFRAETVASVFHLEGEVGIGDPFLFGSNVYADLSATVLRRIEPSFTRVSAGFDFDVAREWDDWIETGISYQLRRSEATDIDFTDPAAIAALNDVDISAIELSARTDNRDNPLNPADGHNARIAVQWADSVLGSELDFLRTRYRQAHYIPFGGANRVLALSVRAGVIVPTHDTVSIPVQERFFNGGENTVRSFRQDELGPLDTQGEPLGGEGFTVLSAELRETLFGNLSGALFADWGNVVPNYEDYLEFEDFETAFGVGVRYLLPIGPLRIDVGWNPNADSKQDGVVAHFSLGLPF